jgi:hypothetical protein
MINGAENQSGDEKNNLDKQLEIFSNQIDGFNQNLKQIFSLEILDTIKEFRLLNNLLAEIKKLVPATNEEREYLKGLCLFLNYLTSNNAIQGLSIDEAQRVIFTLIIGLLEYGKYHDNNDKKYSGLNKYVIKFSEGLLNFLQDAHKDAVGQIFDLSKIKVSELPKFYQRLIEQKRIAKDENSRFVINTLIDLNIAMHKPDYKKLLKKIKNSKFSPNTNVTALLSNFLNVVVDNATTQKAPNYAFLAGILRDCDNIMSAGGYTFGNLAGKEDIYADKTFLGKLYVNPNPIIHGIIRFIVVPLIQMFRPNIAINYAFLDFINTSLTEIRKSLTREKQNISLSKLNPPLKKNKSLDAFELKSTEEEEHDKHKQNHIPPPKSPIPNTYSLSPDFHEDARGTTNLLIKIIQVVKSSLSTKKN